MKEIDSSNFSEVHARTISRMLQPASIAQGLLRLAALLLIIQVKGYT